MSTVATRTTHPALVLRNAVDAITTELVRADIAPSSLTVGQAVHYAASVSLSLTSRRDFESARTLFGFDLIGEHDHDGSTRVGGSGVFMGLFVSAGAPASDEIPADCESAVGTV